MKLIIILSLIALNLCAESKLKFENKIVEEISIQDSQRSFLHFKVLCLNGYQYLYVDSAKSTGVVGSTTQMFYTPKGPGKQTPQPLKCNGYEETKD